MIKSIEDIDNHLWVVIDLDTGKKISLVQWVDDKLGEYVILKRKKDNSGFITEFFGNRTIIKKFNKTGNIKLVRKTEYEQSLKSMEIKK